MEGPFTLRARLLTPLDGGGSRYLDDARVDVDDRAAGNSSIHRCPPPLERSFDRATAAACVPEALRALARAGTTTIVAYGALWPDSTDECFAAAERHGVRAVIGKVMMDRITYNEQIRPTDILEVSLKESADLCERWHGRDDGRLAYAFTPRFAVSCTEQMLRESAGLASHYGAGTCARDRQPRRVDRGRQGSRPHLGRPPPHRPSPLGSRFRRTRRAAQPTDLPP
jgi:hypothetical protein